MMQKMACRVRQRTDGGMGLNPDSLMNSPTNLSRADSMSARPRSTGSGHGGSRPSKLVAWTSSLRRLLPRLGTASPEPSGAHADEDTAMHSPCL
jgi:hypothetical protein